MDSILSIKRMSKHTFCLLSKWIYKAYVSSCAFKWWLIMQVNSTKLLGVKNLNWKCHINDVCLKLSKNTGILYRIRHKLSTETLINLSYSLFYPHLTCCVSLCASTWPSFLNKVAISQSKFSNVYSIWRNLTQQI